MAEYFAGGHLRFVNGEWRDDNGNAIEIYRVRHGRWEQCFEDWRQQIKGDKCSVCGFEHYGASIKKYKYCPTAAHL